MERGVLVVALGWMSVMAAPACGGDDSDDSADASPPLSVGEVCEVLADAYCARNEECSLGVPPPCDETFAAECCDQAGGCEQPTGATAERAEACADGMGAVSCTDLESGALPSPCAAILMSPVTVRVVTHWRSMDTWWPRALASLQSRGISADPGASDRD